MKIDIPLYATTNLHTNDDEYDSIVIVASNLEHDLKSLNLLDAFTQLEFIKKLNSNFEKEPSFNVINNTRLIYSPTGPLDRDFDDVRRIADASTRAAELAIKVGCKKPLLINAVKNKFELEDHVFLLAFLAALYIPLEVCEEYGIEQTLKMEKISFWHSDNQAQVSKMLQVIKAVEIGRIVSRHIGGSDPERMNSQAIHKYVQEIFDSTDIKVEIIEGQSIFERDYPCFAAVNRASTEERHQGRIIKLSYISDCTEPAQKSTNLYLIGKGITYDTGGADIKTNGIMAGNHRDKCGAAMVAGFFKTLSLLKPKGINAYGTMCVARNNVGEKCYVADEIVKSRAGCRVRVVNTDAEGRMAMVDSLCQAKEHALITDSKNSMLFTIATLTGHVVRSYGPNYAAIMSNGPARSKQIDESFQLVGSNIADPFEISTIRREDFDTMKGKSECEDVIQCAYDRGKPAYRGHQAAAAFLILASGLNKHGNDSEQPLSYSHIDVAGSAGSCSFPGEGPPTGSPLCSFVYKFVLPRI